MANPLVQEIKKERTLVVLAVLCSMAAGIAAVLQAKLLADIVNGVFLQHWQLGDCKQLLYGLLGLSLLKAGALWQGERCGFSLSAAIKTKLRQKLLEKLYSLGPVLTKRDQTGGIANVFVEGIDNLDAFLGKYVPGIFIAALLPLIILVFVFSLDLYAALLMLITAPLIPVFMILIGRWASRLQQRQWERLNVLSGHFFEVISGLTTLKVFGISQEQWKVIAVISEQFRDSTLSILRIAFLSALALELLATLSTALVAVIIGLKLLHGSLYFYQAFFILLLAPEYYQPLRQLGSYFHAGINGKQAALKIYEILCVENQTVQAAESNVPALEQPFSIVFDKVSYAYPGAVTPALSEVSLTIKPGQKIALVGVSGAGKSTLFDLLLGFISPTQGRIVVAERSLTEINRTAWLQQVSYVSQVPYLFYGSVLSNISFGGEDTLEDAVTAAKKAGIHQFISMLPKGYATIIGDGGMNLSGGEKQRIVLARAFYKNAPLLLLDEPTASLDVANETLLRQTLFTLMEGKTVLMIVHRLSTAAQADHLLVLHDGEIVEHGNHQQLLEKQGHYYRMITGVRRKPYV